MAAGGGIGVNFTKPVDPQKPFIALYEPQWDDEGEEREEQGTEATARDDLTPPQHEENAPSSRRAFEHARPASN